MTIHLNLYDIVYNSKCFVQIKLKEQLLILLLVLKNYNLKSKLLFIVI